MTEQRTNLCPEITDTMLRIAAGPLHTKLYEFLLSLGLTTRKLKGTVLVMRGDEAWTFDVSDVEGPYADVVACKRDITRRAAVETSGEAVAYSVEIDGDEYIYDGYYEANGLGVGFSGAEAPWDLFYARTMHAFIMALVSFFRGVTRPANIGTAGGDILADNIVGQLLFRRMPPGVQSLFPTIVDVPIEGFIHEALDAEGHEDFVPPLGRPLVPTPSEMLA